MLSHKNLLKSAVIGSSDYHALMRSVVFQILPQAAQKAQVGDSFGDLKIVNIDKWLNINTAYELCVYEYTDIYLNCCHSCTWSYRRAFLLLLDGRWSDYKLRFMGAMPSDKFPMLSPTIPIIVSWVCPVCGKMEAYDDIPF